MNVGNGTDDYILVTFWIRLGGGILAPWSSKGQRSRSKAKINQWHYEEAKAVQVEGSDIRTVEEYCKKNLERRRARRMINLHIFISAFCCSFSNAKVSIFSNYWTETQ